MTGIKYLIFLIMNIFFGISNVQAQNEKVYQVMVDSYSPPFVYATPQGKIIGFDVDILSAIAAQQGLKLKFASHAWKGLFDTLNQNADIVSAGVTITDARRKIMDFTNPYFQSKQVLLFNPKTVNVNSFEQIANLKVAVKENTTSDDLLQKIGSEGKAEYVNTIYAAVKKMLMKRSDAVLGDAGSIFYYKQKFSDLELKSLSDPKWLGENYGFVVRKGNTALLDKLNQGLKVIKNNGVYAKIYKKWFEQSK